MRFRSLVAAFGVSGLVILFGSQPRAVQGVSAKAAQPDLAIEGDLAGDRHILRVEWYHRGPFQGNQGNPPGYVRGLAILDPADHLRVLARWDSERTTLVDCYKTFNNLWPVRRGGGMLTTALVQYGGAVYVLDAFRFEHGELKKVAEVGGRGVWIHRMGSAKRPVLVVRPSDEFALLRLYALDSPRLSRADREFPGFWEGEVGSYAEQIRTHQPLPPEYLARFCELSYQAAELAGHPGMARQPCRDALSKIIGGLVWKGNETQTQATTDENRAANRINAVLSRLRVARKGQRHPPRQRYPDRRRRVRAAPGGEWKPEGDHADKARRLGLLCGI